MPATSQAAVRLGRQPKKTLASLQAGRAVAALLVVLFHVTATMSESPKYAQHAPLGGFFAFGHAGVAFFFVLSGFVILYVHWQDIGFPRRAASYAWKRIRRIYPLYWAILLPVAASYLLLPNSGQPEFHRPDVILSSFLLVHWRTDLTILYVAWTMYHEVLFYALFALLILNKHIGAAALVVWLLASLAVLATHAPFPWAFWGSPLHLQFAMGMGVVWRMRHGSLPFAATTAIAGVLLFVSVGTDEDYFKILSNPQASLLYGIGSAMTLAGLVSLEQDGRIRIPGVVRMIGDASYSIYLVHLPVLSLLALLHVHTWIFAIVPTTVSFVLLIVLAVLPGIATHFVLERPLLRLLNPRSRSPATALPRVASV
jgi:exopolysaccharide production protein ExoZ